MRDSLEKNEEVTVPVSACSLGETRVLKIVVIWKLFPGSNLPLSKNANSTLHCTNDVISCQQADCLNKKNPEGQSFNEVPWSTDVSDRKIYSYPCEWHMALTIWNVSVCFLNCQALHLHNAVVSDLLAYCLTHSSALIQDSNVLEAVIHTTCWSVSVKILKAKGYLCKTSSIPYCKFLTDWVYNLASYHCPE